MAGIRPQPPEILGFLKKRPDDAGKNTQYPSGASARGFRFVVPVIHLRGSRFGI
mgnify:CR=1 FL=1